MKYYLVRFRNNWADEFNVTGAFLINEHEYKMVHEIFDEHKDEIVSCSFGTNEGWDDETLEDFTSSYSFHEISEDEMVVLKKYQHLFSNENVPIFSYLLDFEITEPELIEKYFDEYNSNLYEF
jgi:hypothetical protein